MVPLAARNGAIAGKSAPETDCDQVLRELDVAAQKLKVCGHPVRLRLLCMIARQEDPCVSELWSCLNQPQPVISQHLAVLKDKGIVKSEVSGNRRIYSIVDPFIEGIVASLSPCTHA